MESAPFLGNDQEAIVIGQTLGWGRPLRSFKKPQGIIEFGAVVAVVGYLALPVYFGYGLWCTWFHNHWMVQQGHKVFGVLSIFAACYLVFCAFYFYYRNQRVHIFEDGLVYVWVIGDNYFSGQRQLPTRLNSQHAFIVQYALRR